MKSQNKFQNSSHLSAHSVEGRSEEGENPSRYEKLVIKRDGVWVMANIMTHSVAKEIAQRALFALNINQSDWRKRDDVIDGISLLLERILDSEANYIERLSSKEARDIAIRAAENCLDTGDHESNLDYIALVDSIINALRTCLFYSTKESDNV